MLSAQKPVAFLIDIILPEGCDNLENLTDLTHSVQF